jgi:hypothetical protein
MSTKTLTDQQKTGLMEVLQTRFEKNMHRHKDVKWSDVSEKLESNPAKLWSLNQMEETGGEPDVVAVEKGEYVFFDCSKETPKERRNYCYDLAALESRKKFPPQNDAISVATAMGIDLLTEEEFFYLQKLEPVDTKTSSWLLTPDAVRKHGGAIFGDYRFGRVFIYHNGADSYYGVRGFRGSLRV